MFNGDSSRTSLVRQICLECLCLAERGTLEGNSVMRFKCQLGTQRRWINSTSSPLTRVENAEVSAILTRSNFQLTL